MSSSSVLTSIRHLRVLLAGQRGQETSDEQLLHAFTARRDDSAFAILVRRHGPMVLHVCRRVLGHQQDAEDAFQATFLVLARNAASLGNKTALASWLHGIAYRTALKAKQSAARRRKHEGRAPSRPPVDPCDELSWREVRTLLDEEIARLPEIYRSVFVHCCLENLSRAETAQRLALKERTVLSRLAEARKRLQKQLTRRGVELTALLAAMARVTPSASALPAGLMASTIKAVLATSDGLAGVVSASVAALMEINSPILSLGKVKLAAALVLATSLAAGGLLAHQAFDTKTPPPQAGEKRNARPTAPQRGERENPRELPADSLEVHGVVRGPDGKPITGAKVYGGSTKAGMIRQAVTGKDGCYRFTLRRDAVDPKGYYADPWEWSVIAVVADGCGLAWKELRERGKDNHLDLSLVKDDVPLEGRLVDLEGRPVAGATVRVVRLHATADEDLSAFLHRWRRDPYEAFLGARMLIINAEEMKKPRLLMQKDKEAMPKLAVDFRPMEWRRLWHVSQRGLVPPVKTDKDGKFRLTGLGRERVVEFIVSAPGIEQAQLRAVTRKKVDVKALRKPPADYPLPWPLLYGSAFEHVAAPSKLIAGIIRDKVSGTPLADIRILGRSPLAKDGSFFHDDIETVTDDTGAYRLLGLPKDREYSLLVGAPEGRSYLPQERKLADTPGLEALQADFELQSGVLIRGRLLDKPSGKPIAGVVSYAPLPNNPQLPAKQDAAISRFILEKQFVGTDGTFQFVAYPGPGIVFAAAATGDYLPIHFTPAEKKLGLEEGISIGGQLTRIEGQAHRLIDPKANTKVLPCDLIFQGVSAKK